MMIKKNIMLSIIIVIDDMSEKLASERSVYIAEQCNLQELLSKLQLKQEGMLDIKSILEAEIEARQIPR